MRTLGHAYQKNGEYEKAIQAFEECASLKYEDSLFLESASRRDILTCRAWLNQWVQGRDEYVAFLDKLRTLKDSREMLYRGFIQLATMAGQSGHQDEGRDFLKEAEAMMAKVDRSEGYLFLWLELLGGAAFQVGDFEKAEQYYKQSRQAPGGQELGRKIWYAMVLKVLGLSPELDGLRHAELKLVKDTFATHVRYLAEGDLANDLMRKGILEFLLNTGDDVITINDLRIPVGKKIMLQMTSKDVIHAFYLPNVRLKADVIPGRMGKLWFDTNKTGVFEIACAEMCGTHHYLMRGQMTVLSQEDFDSWKQESEQIATATNDQENPDLRWGWKWGSN